MSEKPVPYKRGNVYINVFMGKALTLDGEGSQIYGVHQIKLPVASVIPLKPGIKPEKQDHPI